MPGRLLKSLALATALSAGSIASADAAVFSLGGFSGMLPTDTSITRSFVGTAGSGILQFVINGFASLDGQNSYEDDLSVSVNGTTIFSGTFDLGGGGNNVVYTGGPGTTANTSGVSFFGGGTLSVATPVTVLNGLNTVTFTYASLSGNGFAGFQGTGDEAWAVSSGSVTSAVPEPSTWAMLMAGFAGLTLMLRRRSRRLVRA